MRLYILSVIMQRTIIVLRKYDFRLHIALIKRKEPKDMQFICAHEQLTRDSCDVLTKKFTISLYIVYVLVRPTFTGVVFIYISFCNLPILLQILKGAHAPNFSKIKSYLVLPPDEEI